MPPLLGKVIPKLKRQWERDYREQRNAARRAKPVFVHAAERVTPRPDNPISKERQTVSGIVGLSLGEAFVMLAMVAGISVPANPDVPRKAGL